METIINKQNVKLNKLAYSIDDRQRENALELYKAALLPRVLYINVSVYEPNTLTVNYQLINTIGRYTIITNNPNDYELRLDDEPSLEGSTNMGVQLQHIDISGMVLGLVEYYNNTIYFNVQNKYDGTVYTNGTVYEAFIKIELYDTAVSISY